MDLYENWIGKHVRIGTVRLKSGWKNGGMWVGCLVVLLLVPSCGKSNAVDVEGRDRVAVTTSWIECCVRDVGGDSLPIVRLCPPGSCPGHFDLSPGSIRDLEASKLLFLFDFQRSIQEKIQSLPEGGPRIATISVPKGLCVPGSYLAGCEAVVKILGIQDGTSVLKRIEERLKGLEVDVLRQIADGGLKGAKVITSGHQAAFCRWLGLEPVATYSGPDAATPAQLQAIVQEGKAKVIRFVIANLQEGPQAGEALANQCGAQLVVFSNFPNMEKEHDSFDALVRDNVKALVEGAGKSS